MPLTEEELDRFVSRCIDRGWTVRYRNHPKTRASWDNVRRKRTER